MSESVPPWLQPPPAPAVPAWLAPPPSGPAPVKVPDWLTAHPKRELSPLVPMGKSAEQKALIFQQFEMVFPRLMEMVTEGYTLNKAINELPILLDVGAFTRWLYKDPERVRIYEESRKYRTEVWAGEIIKHATADEDNEAKTYVHDTSRSRLIVDTYKFLMGAHNKKEYGDSKEINITGQISIRAAMEAANSRVMQPIIDAEVIEETTFKQLPPAWDDEDDDA